MALVFCRRFWMPGNQVFAFMILTIGYSTTYGVTIYMHIQRTHKNRKLQAAIRKIFIRLHFFNHYYCSIAWRYYRFFSAMMRSGRYTKKRKKKDQQRKACYKNQPGN